jgi:hypothetical protein
MYTICSPHVLQKEELLTKNHLYTMDHIGPIGANGAIPADFLPEIHTVSENIWLVHGHLFLFHIFLSNLEL